MMGSSIFSLLLSSFLLCTFLLHYPTHAIRKSYVVYLGSHSHGPNPSSADMDSATNSHYDLLASVLGSREKAKEAIFYSYNKHINGFAALLEEEEAEETKKMAEVVSVFVNKMHKLHTTRSWEFLELEKNGRILGHSAWKKGGFGENTIIGNIDTGVWPESESFSDRGYGPIPAKWRGGGACHIHSLPHSNQTLCNRPPSWILITVHVLIIETLQRDSPFSDQPYLPFEFHSNSKEQTARSDGNDGSDV